MTAAFGRRAPGRGLHFWSQWGGGLIAVGASLAALSLPSAARAATTPGYDQMTGVGPTASVVTAQWTQGLLDNTNTAITGATGLGSNADRTNKSSSLWFMYQEFQNLSVTVSQTQNIGHQGVTVNWTWTNANGPVQTARTGTVQANFLQMMECYGDATTGPDPNQCQYGSAGLLSATVLNPQIGERTGSLCPTGAAASTSSPPRSADGAGPQDGCDPLESGITSDLAPCPTSTPNCTQTGFDIPFVPVTPPNTPDYTIGDTTYYNEFNTDEVQEAVTGANGTGQQQFETLTGVQASGLGCGETESNGQPRGCWLVIVPRGTYEPNGYQVNVNNAGVGSFLGTSPLSASNWAMRIQIHLGFSPVGSFCPAGTQEIQTFGTQLVTRAMQSWQIALNQAGNCKQVFAYSAVTEQQNTLNLTAGGDVGLAFTTIPIGSEATRSGGSPPANLPTILYAPVAVAAVDFGFNIDVGSSGYVTTPVNLTPLLLAKAMTQSYKEDLPDYFPDYQQNGPTWAVNNPYNISTDPQFHNLNKEVPEEATGPNAPLLTEDHSAVNQQVWQWIQADSTASGWLNGTPDATDNGMVVDPDYKALNLGTPPAIDSYPRAYQGVLNYTPTGGTQETKNSIDLLPYTDNFDSAAQAVLTANNQDLSGPWNLSNESPSLTPGWWDKRGVEALGQIFMWAADDTPDLAAYGLVPAQLCNDSGSTCVSPSTAAVTAAVSAATPDSSGLLHVNAASPGTGAYPLTDIVYAAVATNQSAAALEHDASLISYAVTTGQTTGSAPGDLPPGYLPLPSNLVTKAQAIVTQLQGLASPSPSPSPSSSSSSSSTSTSSSSSLSGQSTTAAVGSSTTAGSTGTSGTTGGSTPTPTPAAALTRAPTTAAVPAATPASSLGKLPVTSSTHPAGVVIGLPTPQDYVTSLPPNHPAAGTTPQQPVGVIRWVLIGLAVAGGALAGGGTLLRSKKITLWHSRPGTGP